MDMTKRPVITPMATFSVVTMNYLPISSGWTTRKGAVRSATAQLVMTRVIQGGYDENGLRYFREVYPRILRTWTERFHADNCTCGCIPTQRRPTEASEPSNPSPAVP